MSLEKGIERGFQFFNSLAGGLLDMVFGRGGDGGGRWSSAEDYVDIDGGATPDIHIHGNLHTDQGQGAANSQDNAPAPLVVDASMANALALQEGYALPNENPVLVLRAPDYPPAPSTSDVNAAAFNRAWEHSQDDGMRLSH